VLLVNFVNSIMSFGVYLTVQKKLILSSLLSIVDTGLNDSIVRQIVSSARKQRRCCEKSFCLFVFLWNTHTHIHNTTTIRFSTN